MGLFDDFQNHDRKKVLTVELNNAKVQLYSVLMQLNIDPDTFDETSWTEPADLGGEPKGRVRHYIDLIARLNEKLSQIVDE